MNEINPKNFNTTDLLSSAQAEKIRQQIAAKGLTKNGEARFSQEEKEKILENCKMLEASFFDLMVKQMRETTDEIKELGGSEDYFGDSSSTDAYYQMYDQALSEEWSKREGTGLAYTLFRQLTGEDYKKEGAKNQTTPASSAPPIIKITPTTLTSPAVQTSPTTSSKNTNLPDQKNPIGQTKETHFTLEPTPAKSNKPHDHVKPAIKLDQDGLPPPPDIDKL